MPLIQLTPALAEPITLAEAKLHLRVDIADDDLLIEGLIVAARQFAEMVCRRVFISQTWRLYLDQFPSPAMNISSATWYGPQWGIGPGPLSTLSPSGKTGFEILLPPIISVDAVQYIEAVTGTLTTLAPAQYKLDAASKPARLVPAYNQTWPATRNEINAVQIDMTAGYGTPADVPEGIKNWIKIRIATLYQHREEIEIVSRGKLEPLPYVDRLLDPYRIVSF